MSGSQHAHARGAATSSFGKRRHRHPRSRRRFGGGRQVRSRTGCLQVLILLALAMLFGLAYNLGWFDVFHNMHAGEGSDSIEAPGKLPDALPPVHGF